MANAPVTSNSMPGAAGHDSGFLSSQNNPYTILETLRQHPRYTEYERQILALLLATEQVFHHLRCLRFMSDAPSILEDLLLANIYLIPPTDIWILVINLRTHSEWRNVRSLIQSQITRPRHYSCSTTSTRESANSNGSFAHLSSASCQSRSTHDSNYSLIEPVQEAPCEDQQLHQPARSDTVRGPQRGVLKNGKASKKAPADYSFTCPYAEYAQCRKWRCKRERDFHRHVGFEHRSEEPFNAWHFLKPDPPGLGAPTPVKSDTTEHSATLPPDSPSSMYAAEVNNSDDVPATGPGFHLPTQDLIPISNYYGHTGVHAFQVNTSSYFDFNDEMEEK